MKAPRLIRTDRALFLAIAERLMRCPAAPYFEDQVRAEAEAICAENGLAFERDSFGNVLIRLATVRRLRPLVLSAHLDHPGFEILGRTKTRTFRTRFHGGVPASYFKPGVPLRLMPGASAGKLGRRSEQPGEFEIKVEAETVSAPQFAVWELPDFRRVRQQIHGRVCDDLIGVASILATLVALRRARAKVNVLGVLTRAEEVGFHGALALADSGRIPKEALVISLETSRELPPVQMGHGVILRVGDRASVFNSNATRFLAEVARELAEANKTFKVQRALMSGGTCEGTAYQEFGFETAAVCVALGNYHNCGPQDRIAVEFVDVRDALGMCDLLAAAARQMAHYREFIGRLPLRLRKLLTEARQRFGREAGA